MGLSNDSQSEGLDKQTIYRGFQKDQKLHPTPPKKEVLHEILEGTRPPPFWGIA